MNRLTILFFANLRETLGCSELAVRFVAGETITDLVERLIKEHGHAFQALSDQTVKAAINSTVVNRQDLISADAEIAFFPPVTGG